MKKNTTVAIIEDGAKLGLFIAAIARAGVKLDKDVHIAAVSAAAHFNAHGDVFQINNLYGAMPKGSRHVALTGWLLAYAGVQANTGANKDKTPFVKDKDKTVDLTGGMENPWFTFKPSKKPDQVIDLLALVLKGIKRATTDGVQVEHEEMLTDLQALAEKYGTEEEAGEADGTAATVPVAEIIAE